MNSKLICLFALSTWLLASCVEPETNQEPVLIPAVNQIQMGEGYFTINSDVQLMVAPGAEAEAAYLRGLLGAGIRLEDIDYKKGRPPSGTILLNLIKGDSLSEKYALLVSEDVIWLTSDGRPGLMRGIQTLRQILGKDLLSSAELTEIRVPALQIEDHPAFKHRGMLLDCCRHFMDKDFVKRYIDLLAFHRMNVLHWHLTEDQGWRIQIDAYPKLTEVGAWRTGENGELYGGFYTKDDIREIVAYAAERHITVIPEIELPGHSSAAVASYPWLSCTGEQIPVETEWGVFKDIYCAGNDTVFGFLETVLDEVIELFPGPYVHIGGDEAPKFRWEHCDKCQKRIADEGLEDEHELQSWFISRVGAYLESKGKQMIGWDEILEGGLPEGAIVQSWRGMEGAVKAMAAGQPTILSPTSHAYFDYDLKAIDLAKVYEFDPVPNGTPEDQRDLIMGGECNMWTERAPQDQVDSKVFPRILAMAEVLWAYPKNRDYPSFQARVRKHYEILEALGVNYGLEAVPVSIRSELGEDGIYLQLEPGTTGLQLEYSLDGGSNWTTADSLIALTESGEVKARAFLLETDANGSQSRVSYGDPVSREFAIHKGLRSDAKYQYTYSPYYPGGGANGLLNGTLGTLDFRDGNWQGVTGSDINVEVDLGESRPISRLSTNYYQYANAWIFLPVKVEYWGSENGEDWQLLGSLAAQSAPERKDQFIESFSLESSANARYLRMVAHTLGKNPDWHDAPGADCWLFCDEWVIE